MPAKQNYFIILEKETDSPQILSDIIEHMWPWILDNIGPLYTRLVLDYDLWTSHYHNLSSVGLPPQVPFFADTELVTFYPKELDTDCLPISKEGDFWTYGFSLLPKKHSLVLKPLKELWQMAKEFDVHIVISGEELEICEKDIDSLLKKKKAPLEIDLCDCAILSDKFFKEAKDSETAIHFEGGYCLQKSGSNKV